MVDKASNGTEAIETNGACSVAADVALDHTHRQRRRGRRGQSFWQAKTLDDSKFRLALSINRPVAVMMPGMATLAWLGKLRFRSVLGDSSR